MKKYAGYDRVCATVEQLEKIRPFLVSKAKDAEAFIEAPEPQHAMAIAAFFEAQEDYLTKAMGLETTLIRYLDTALVQEKETEDKAQKNLVSMLNNGLRQTYMILAYASSNPFMQLRESDASNAWQAFTGGQPGTGRQRRGAATV